MKDFIESIFTTPVNLWTIGQELFVFAVAIVLVLLGCGIIWGICLICEKAKYRKCSLSGAINCERKNCENCKWNKKKFKSKRKRKGVKND